jgi:predicted DNA repair protein MutK
VVGFASDRELPIIGKIAWGSIKNKLVILLPGALMLSFFAPWAITPLLMRSAKLSVSSAIQSVSRAAPRQWKAPKASKGCWFRALLINFG